jgi:lysophospholipid acyltransferase (LPLAT)-like uncharacterized protein
MQDQKDSSLSFFAQMRVQVFAALGAALLKGISATVRWEQAELSEPTYKDVEGKAAIITFWHDRQLMMFPGYFSRRSKLVALASRHSDGRIIAGILEWLGFRTVAGSSSRGGAVALKQLVGLVREGWDVGITPDGPRGPRHVIKDGVVKLAQLTGAPIIPCSYSTQHRWCFRSWDKIFLPKPFTRGIYLFAPPIFVERNLTEEGMAAAVALVQSEVDRVTRLCEEYEYR